LTCDAASTCLSCEDTEAELSNGVCTCRAGFYDYDDSTNLRCHPCNSQCSTCNAALKCLSCVDTHAEAVYGVCACKEGFISGRPARACLVAKGHSMRRISVQAVTLTAGHAETSRAAHYAMTLIKSRG
jgi:hypothetical protein